MLLSEEQGVISSSIARSIEDFIADFEHIASGNLQRV